jgi:hypothetical protein
LSCPKPRPSVNSFGAGSLEAEDTISWPHPWGKRSEFWTENHLGSDSNRFFRQIY